MSRSVIVSRESLGLEALQLSQADLYYLPDGTFGGGQTSQRQTIGESPQVKGSYPSSSVEASRSGNMSVHVFGTEETLQDNIQAVIDAMTQFMYMLDWKFDGLSGLWQCWASSWELGESGTLDAKFLKLNTQIVHFVIPHNRISGF